MNIFEKASRKGLRIQTGRGLVTVEQLWELPLVSSSSFSLDSIAQQVHGDLQAVTTASFVDTKPHPKKQGLRLQLEILKHIIDSKQADAIRTQRRVKNAEEKRKLVGALATIEQQELSKKTPEEIRAAIAKLD